jgi:hypothetical protein
MRAWGGGEETPFKHDSSGDGDEEGDEDKEEGVITPSPHSTPPEDLPSLGDLFSWQAGISVSVRWTKRPRMGLEALSGLPPQSGLMLVCSDLLGMSVCTNGDKNNSLARGFVGPTVLAGCRGCCVHDGRAR